MSPNDLFGVSGYDTQARKENSTKRKLTLAAKVKSEVIFNIKYKFHSRYSTDDPNSINRPIISIVVSYVYSLGATEARTCVNSGKLSSPGGITAR